jgi:hypothetical protein
VVERLAPYVVALVGGPLPAGDEQLAESLIGRFFEATALDVR